MADSPPMNAAADQYELSVLPVASTGLPCAGCDEVVVDNARELVFRNSRGELLPGAARTYLCAPCADLAIRHKRLP